MRKAIQENCVVLVDNLILIESELSDLLIEKDCLSEAECLDLRNLSSGKDQIRNLLRMLKGRSFKVLTSFLKCLKRTNPDIEKLIMNRYEKILLEKESAQQPRECAFCGLKRFVDIKMVADYLWSDDLISDYLYDNIVRESSRTDILWDDISRESLKHKNADNFTTVIAKVLRLKEKYQELVYKLSKEQRLVCSCRGDTEVIFASLPSICDENTTVSPRSSLCSLSSQQDHQTSVESHTEDSPQNRHHNLFLSRYNTTFGVSKSNNKLLVEESDQNFRTRSHSLFQKAGEPRMSARRLSAVL